MFRDFQSVDYCRIEARIEAICGRGCVHVRRDIATLEAGAQLPETLDLSEDERRLLLAELKQIMAVYGDFCRIV
jgi:hypothetical protein